jgi:voltage-gated potassium channel
LLSLQAGQEWSYIDCLYMTVISVATVGYGEIVPVREVPWGESFTIFIILFGGAALVYFGSTTVALFVEEDLREAWRRGRMRKVIARMKNHIIVCGTGATGATVVRELLATRYAFVAVDRDAERLQRLEAEAGKGGFPQLVGDATDDDILIEAGVREASGLVAALPTDKDNLFVTVSARQLNPRIRVVSRAIEPGMDAKLKRAGASDVISPNAIGGMRMASVMIRPQVVEFLDKMLRDRDKNLRIEQVTVPDDSPLVGKALRDTPIRKITQLLVIAAYPPGAEERYVYNPGPDFILTGGVVLVVLGMVDDVIRLREYFGSPELHSTLPPPP